MMKAGLALAGRALVLLVVLGVTILPFAMTMSLEERASRVRLDALIAFGTAYALGLAVLIRVRGREGLLQGVLLGFVIGCVMALVAGSTSANGFLVMLPPSVGLGLGLLERLGGKPVDGFWRSVRFGVLYGALIGMGIAMRQSIAGPIAGAALGYVIGVVMSSQKDGEEGWRAGFVRPPWLAMAGAFAIMGLAFYMLQGEFENPAQRPFKGLGTALNSLIFVSQAFGGLLLFYVAGRALAAFLRPRLAVYGELIRYLRIMWVPVGGFALGVFVLVVLFSGFYGTLYRFAPRAFDVSGLGGGEPTPWDWVFFSMFTVVAPDYTGITPMATHSKALVAIQLSVGVGWAVVVFAAVMALLRPQLDAAASEAERDAGSARD